MNETSKQPPSDEAPPGDEPQPLRTEDQARVAKLAAEEALIREQLKRAELENNAAEREAKTWHKRYTFVPSPRVALQAIVAGVVMVIALFAFYQPLVDRVKNETIKTVTIAEKNAMIAKLDTDIQQKRNQQLSTQLDDQKKQLDDQKKQLDDQNKAFTAELKKTVERSKETEKNLNEAVQLAEKMKEQLQERTAEYEENAITFETDKSRFQQLARQEQARAEELAKQLKNLQTKAQTAKEQTALVQKEVDARPKLAKLLNNNSKKYLAVGAARTDDGANVVIWDNIRQRDIWWYLEPQGENRYKIRNANSSKYLAVARAERTNGANVVQYKDIRQKDIIWDFEQIPSESSCYKIRNVNSSKYLAVARAERTNGANVVQYNDIGQKDIIWCLEYQ